MHDYQRNLDDVYDTLKTTQFNGINVHAKPWPYEGYDVVDVDPDLSVYPSVSINGSSYTELKTPEDVIHFYVSGKKEKVIFPNLKDRDTTASAALRPEHSLFRVFSASFVLVLTHQGWADYGDYRFYFFPEATCVEVRNRQGRPKFWLVNVYSIVSSKETLQEDIQRYMIEFGYLFMCSTPGKHLTLEDSINDLVASKWPPRPIARGSIARKLFLSYCPEFNYDIKDAVPRKYLRPFLNLKGQRFTVSGVGMTGHTYVADFEALYKNIGDKLIPPVDGGTGTFVESEQYQDDAIYASIPVIGNLPLIAGSGILPVRQAVGKSRRATFAGLGTLETRLTYPIGPTDSPIHNISLPEYRFYAKEMGINLGIAGRATWFIPNGSYQAPTSNYARWKDAITAFIKTHPKYKFLYQFAFTGGTYPVYDLVKDYPDGRRMPCPMLIQTGDHAVAGSDYVRLSHIFGLSRVLSKKLSMITHAKAITADGTDSAIKGPETIDGFRVRYSSTPTPGFIFDPMRIDETDDYWQSEVYKHRDEASLPVSARTRVSIYDTNNPMDIAKVKDIGRELLPSGGDTQILPFNKLGYLLDKFFPGEPLHTQHKISQPFLHTQLRRLRYEKD